MRIGGLQPFSLTDFPGKIAAIFFTVGCSFACPYCYNKDLWNKKHPTVPKKEVFDFLESKRGKLEGIVITGGEPAIQIGLANFIEKIKEYGYLVKLDTNGGHPDVLADLIHRKLVDYIAMDVKAPFDKYHTVIGMKEAPIERIKESIRIIVSSGIDHEFRTTLDLKTLTREDIKTIKTYFPETSFHRTQDCIYSENEKELQ